MERGENQTILDDIRPPEPLRQEADRIKFFASVDESAINIVLETPHFVPMGVTNEQANAALKEKNYPDKSDATHKDLLSLARTKERIARRMIKKTLEGENRLDLSETEKTIILASCDLGEHFDEFSMQWRDAIKNEPEDTANFLAQRQEDFLYVVGKEDPDTHTTQLISYAEAFSEPIGKIRTTIDGLVASLTEIKTPDDAIERQAFIDYYKALSDALSTEDISEHEERFATVDRKWMQIKGRMQPIHMIETIHDPHRRIEPDYALVFREGNAMNDQMDAMKQPLIAAINEISRSRFLTAQSLGGVFMPGIQAGMRLDFTPAGQFIPNRHEVRLTGGLKIFINFDAIEKGRALQNLLHQNVFEHPPEISDDDLNRARALFVNGHEIAHNSFLDVETRQQLGDQFKQLEEVKSDITTFAAIPKFLPEDQQNAMIVSLLDASLRYFKFGKLTNRMDYYKSGAAVLRTMLDAGVIQQDGDLFTLDLATNKKEELFARAKEVAKELTEVYTASPDQMRKKADGFKTKYCKEPEENESLYVIDKKLNQALEN